MSRPSHTSSTARINKAIRDAGIEHVTLRAGRGYQYFVFSNGDRFETECEYVYRIREHSVERWVELARAFAESTRAAG